MRRVRQVRQGTSRVLLDRWGQKAGGESTSRLDAPAPSELGAIWIDPDESVAPAVYVPSIPLTSVLPVSPVDKQEIYFQTTGGSDQWQTQGVVWHLRYRAGSTSPYKWEILGGQPLFASGGNPSVTSTSFVTFAGAPTMHLPAKGEYRIEIGAYGNIVPSTGGTLAYAVGAAAPSPADALSFGGDVSSQAHVSSMIAFLRTFTDTPWIALTQQIKSSGSGSSTFSLSSLWFRATPIRLSS